MRLEPLTIEQAIAHFEYERDNFAGCILKEKFDSPAYICLMQAMQANELAIRALRAYKDER